MQASSSPSNPEKKVRSEKSRLEQFISIEAAPADSGKKLIATVQVGRRQPKRVPFGSASNYDFLWYSKHRSPEYAAKRKELFYARHGHATTSDVATARFLSAAVLWNKPTIAEAVSDLQERLGVPVHIDIAKVEDHLLNKKRSAPKKAAKGGEGGSSSPASDETSA